MLRAGIVSFAIASWIIVPATSHAIYVIPNCSAGQAASNVNARLDSDITCNPSNGDIGVTLNSGADLDMNGHSIICASGQTCGNAIKMNDTNSIVDGGGSIVGNFTKIVDCQNKTGSKVSGIKFDGYTVNGMYSCKEVTHNVLVGQPLSGTDSAQATTNSLTITDNYMEGFALPILYTSSFSTTITHNLINTTGTAIWYNVYGSGTVSDNVLIGPDSPATSLIVVISSDFATYSNNFCDATSSGCTSCVSAGRCSLTPAVPFNF